MKQTLRTLLKDVDDMPLLHFENLDNDKDAEIFKNEYWKYTAEKNRMEIQDIVDKKQVFMFGRSFDQWQIIDGIVRMSIEDPMDFYVSRYTDPSDLHSSRFLCHTHIFRPWSQVENNPEYDKSALARLKIFYATQQGLIKLASNKDELQEKNKKMEDLGVLDVNDPVLGESYVELTMHFTYEDKEEQLYLWVECDDQEILMKKPLEEVIGVTKDHYFRNHFPYVSWADDIERQDFWSDGVADIVRTPNKVLNSWFSQLVENRTLRNFGMNYFDATIEGFVPPSNQPPIPGGWYPLPGKPSEVYQKVDVPDLSESLGEMTFIIQMIEKATGATATQQGAQTERQVTLGEVQLALGEAKERIKGMSKFYTQAWKDRGIMFDKMCEAASSKLDAVKIFKKGRNTDDMYTREITPKDWRSEAGYNVKVWSQDEKNEKDTKEIEKINAVSLFIPGNPKLEEIKQRKLLEYAGLNPDEINDIIETEKQRRQMMAMNPMMDQAGGQPSGQPGTPTSQRSAQPVQRPPAQV